MDEEDLYFPKMKPPKMWALQPDLFEYRFKRKCKEWTIEEVHDLWLRSLERKEKQLDVSRKLWDEIIKNMAPAEHEPFKIYAEGDDNTTWEYSFTYHIDWGGYGCSSGWVRFSEDPKVARDEKIEFLIANDEAYKWGEIYREDSKQRPKLYFSVQEVFFNMIYDKLRKKFDRNEVRPKEIFRIRISNKEYYIKASGDGLHLRKYWVKYEFAGPVLDNTLDF